MMYIFGDNISINTRFTVKEHTIMAANLSDVISSILMNNLKNTIYNELVKGRHIRTAALVKSRLRREQVHFVDLINTGKLDVKRREKYLISIMELKEEYEDLMSRTYVPYLLKVDMMSTEWRCVFHTREDRNISKPVIDFVRIYNRWTIASAEYMFLKALRDIECGNDYEHNQKNDKKADNQITLAKEYTERISKQHDLLRSYLQDLHDIAKRLDTEYGIFDILEKASEEYELIDTPGSVDTYIGINTLV